MTHLSIVADDVRLWVRLRERQGKHRINKYCKCTVVAEGQRDALPWTDVTLSTSCNMCHEWTSGRTSMNKFTGRRKCAFPDPCVMVSLSCSHMYYHISQYWTCLFLATINKCSELRKYAFPDQCLLKWKLLYAHHALKILDSECSWTDIKHFSEQVNSRVQHSFIEITERLFKKAVPIYFVYYFTTNNILWT